MWHKNYFYLFANLAKVIINNKLFRCFFLPAADSEKSSAAVNGANSTADKPEAAQATENGEKAIDEKNPAATWDSNVTGSAETPSASVDDQTTATSSPEEHKMESKDQEAVHDDKVPVASAGVDDS